MGELHTTMAALRAVGSFIEESGVDDAWIESGLYGPATVRQMLECKHYKRTLSAHMMTLQALGSLYQNAFLKDCPDKKVTETLTELRLPGQEDEDEMKQFHKKLTEFMDANRHYYEDFNERNCNRPMFAIYLEYMEMILSILRFIQATRQGNWQMHLQSLENLTKYYFALDRVKYARMAPLYLAEMIALEHSDPAIWNEFSSGNFVVNKNSVPSCAIGPDHAIEHENRWMKVRGGIVGITTKDSPRSPISDCPRAVPTLK